MMIRLRELMTNLFKKPEKRRRGQKINSEQENTDEISALIKQNQQEIDIYRPLSQNGTRASMAKERV